MGIQFVQPVPTSLTPNDVKEKFKALLKARGADGGSTLFRDRTYETAANDLYTMLVGGNPSLAVTDKRYTVARIHWIREVLDFIEPLITES